VPDEKAEPSHTAGGVAAEGKLGLFCSGLSNRWQTSRAEQAEPCFVLDLARRTLANPAFKGFWVFS
jgi:hypothetical protein